VNDTTQPSAEQVLFEEARRVMHDGGLGNLALDAGIPAQVMGVDALFDVVFTEHDVHDYRTTLKGDAQKLARFNKLLRERGIFKGDSKFYTSLAHDDTDINQTLEAFAAVAKTL